MKQFYILLIALLSLGVTLQAQNPCGQGTIIINGNDVDAVMIDGNNSQGLSLPIWLSSGSTLATGDRVQLISVIEFNKDAQPGGGSTLVFNDVLEIGSTQQTVPNNKVWKVEAIVKYANPFISGLSISSNSPICHNNTLNLTTSITGATYSWTGPNGFTSASQNPTINNADINNSGMYYLTVLHNGCTHSDSISATINPLPSSAFTNTMAVENTPSTFTPTVSGATYTWTFASGNPTISYAENPQVTWTTAGNYNVNLTVTDINGCSSTTQQSVTVTGYSASNFATFNYTGAYQQYTVPTGVSLIHIETWGANGGDARNGTGGIGGYSKGDLVVTPGTTYYIYVGGKGNTGGPGTGDPAIPGGWNGGGALTGSFSAGLDGGSGGGGTDVRTTQNSSYSNRIIVAGGGGGASGYNTHFGDGGNGGGITGSDGTSSRGLQYIGEGGTQTSGGTGSNDGTRTTPGSLGLGGSFVGTLGGSAGGGGYYGGGGAHWGGAGGGGSGYVGGVINTVIAQPGEPGFVANPDSSGNGHVIISW